MNSGPVLFPDWMIVLNAGEPAPQSKAAFLREILAFLKYCKAARAAATNEGAKQYLAWREPGLGVRSPLDATHPGPPWTDPL